MSKSNIKLIYEGIHFIVLYCEKNEIGRAKFFRNAMGFDKIKSSVFPSIVLFTLENDNEYDKYTHTVRFEPFNRKFNLELGFNDGLLDGVIDGEKIKDILYRLDDVLNVMTLYDSTDNNRLSESEDKVSSISDIFNRVMSYSYFCSKAFRNDCINYLKEFYMTSKDSKRMFGAKLLLSYYALDICKTLVKWNLAAEYGVEKFGIFTLEYYPLVSEIDYIFDKKYDSHERFIEDLTIAVLDNDFCCKVGKKYLDSDKKVEQLFTGFNEIFEGFDDRVLIFGNCINSCKDWFSPRSAGLYFARMQTKIDVYFLASLMDIVYEDGFLLGILLDDVPQYTPELGIYKEFSYDTGALQIKSYFHFTRIYYDTAMHDDLIMKKEAFNIIEPFVKYAWVASMVTNHMGGSITKLNLEVKEIIWTNVKVELSEDRRGIRFTYSHKR